MTPPSTLKQARRRRFAVGLLAAVALFSPRLSQAQPGFQVVHHLDGAGDGYFPLGFTRGSDGRLYGTTNGGGSADDLGIIFRVNQTDGSLEVLKIFSQTDRLDPLTGGAYPTAIMRASDGNLYGTTEFGGVFDGGTIYRLTTPESPATPVYEVIHSFKCATDGGDPWGRLTEGPDGFLYGMTVGDVGVFCQIGANRDGTLFKIRKDGFGFQVLAVFNAVTTGTHSFGPVVIANDGSVYGTTIGTVPASPLAPSGTVFRVPPGGGAIENFHIFAPDGSEGSDPRSGLIRGADGAMYGSTTEGGALGGGTIFRITEDSTDVDHFTTLHSFNPASGLFSPGWGPLLGGGDGKLYGATWDGGSGVGGIYEFDTLSGFVADRVFNNALDGSQPFGTFTVGTDRFLHGVNAAGGASDSGTVYTLLTPIANWAPDAFATYTPNPAFAADSSGAEVTLSGAGSSDQDFDTLSFHWVGLPPGSTGENSVTATGTFPPGTTTVTLEVSDGNHPGPSTYTFDVVVLAGFPIISAPSAVVEEAVGPGGAVVNFTVTASDPLGGGSVPVTCGPLTSGDNFPIATTMVTCSATTVTGTSSVTFPVTVQDTTAPVIEGSLFASGITTAATSAGGAIVVFIPLPTATDIVDPSPSLNCSSSTGLTSGSMFPIGVTAFNQTQVTCTATDAAGNSSSRAFNVWVRDDTAPTLTVPGDITAEATVPGGAVVNFTVTATDFDPNPTINCTHASGSTFALGTTAVTCTVTDASGNSSQGTFHITVQDTTLPVVTVPGNIGPLDGNTLGGRVVTFAASALDNGAPLPVTCVPPSGSTFGVATTPVLCTATDAAGNVGSRSFTVTIVDTTPPLLTVPANITVSATSSSGAVVTFSATATDSVDGPSAVVCMPPSGSPFPIGPTTVSCTASDTQGNTTTKTFTVTVIGGRRLATFVAFSSEQTWLFARARVMSGDVGANSSLDNHHGDHNWDDEEDHDWDHDWDHDGDHSRDRDWDRNHSRGNQNHDHRVEVRIGPQAMMLQPGSEVVGDTVWLQPFASVYNVTYNELIRRRAQVLGTETHPVTLPLLPLPALPSISPGTQDVTVPKNGTLTLPAGRYRRVLVKQGGTLILTGGTYHVQSFDVDNQGTVKAKARTEVRVRGALDADARAKIITDPTVPGLGASQVIFYVAGLDNECRHDGRGPDDDRAGPTVVRIGTQSTVQANIYAPRGTVWLQSRTTGVGAFIGKRVRIGVQAQLTLDSAF